MTEHDTAAELERLKAKEEAEANMAISNHEAAKAAKAAKQELKYGVNARSLQRNCSIAARSVKTKPASFHARANIRGKQR